MEYKRQFVGIFGVDVAIPKVDVFRARALGIRHEVIHVDRAVPDQLESICFAIPVVGNYVVLTAKEAVVADKVKLRGLQQLFDIDVVDVGDVALVLEGEFTFPRQAPIREAVLVDFRLDAANDVDADRGEVGYPLIAIDEGKPANPLIDL